MNEVNFKKTYFKNSRSSQFKLWKNIYQALLLKWINLFINYDIVFNLLKNK